MCSLLDRSGREPHSSVSFIHTSPSSTRRIYFYLGWAEPGRRADAVRAGSDPACHPRGVLRGVSLLGVHRLGLLLAQELLPDHLGTERPGVLDPGPDEERDYAEAGPGEHDPDGRPAGALEDVDPAD